MLHILRVVSIAGAVLGINNATISSRDAHGLASVPSCAADSGYSRLAFWVGDWAVYDTTTGKRYASQRVTPVVDECALTVEWTGTLGDKGLSVYAYDAHAGGWKQMYVSNQLPQPTGVILRQSDPDYHGPGVRFIPIVAPTPGAARDRVTILPISGGRVTQLFEESRDDGRTWKIVFNGENRPQS